MFVSENQFFVFIACLSFGVSFGFLFSISKLIKSRISSVFLRILPDLVVFLLLSVAYVLYSHYLKFPNFRLYMIIGIVLGILIYLKSLHILLAKYLKMSYNILSRKAKDKKLKNGSKQG